MKHVSALQDRRRTISSEHEGTGIISPPSSRVPRWKASWTALRTHVSKHRKVTTVLGAVVLGLAGGVGKILGQELTEHVLTWAMHR
jgi:hypothetical protein